MHDNLNDKHASASLSEAYVRGGVALLLLLCFLWFIIQARQLPPAYTEAEIGPAQFPVLVGWGGVLLSICMLISAIRSRHGRRAISVGHPRATIIFAGLLPAYVVLIPSVGFYLSSLIMIPLIMAVAGERRRYLLALAPLGFDLFVFLSFDLALGVPLP